MLRVVSSKICPFVQWVVAALAVRGVEYEVSYISLGDKPQWFKDISPNAQVPILITEDESVLFESGAIVEYIEEIAGALVPDVTAEARARERAWAALANNTYLKQCSAMRSADEETLETRCLQLKLIFNRVLDAHSGGRFFSGDKIGNVDIAWVPLLYRAHLIKHHTKYNFFENLTAVEAWQASVLATGLGEASVPDDFESHFVNYYLSKDSFLGKGYHENTHTPTTPDTTPERGCC